MAAGQQSSWRRHIGIICAAGSSSACESERCAQKSIPVGHPVQCCEVKEGGAASAALSDDNAVYGI